MTRKDQRSAGERALAPARRAPTAKGVPVTRGEDFVRLQMSLGLPSERKGGKKAGPTHSLVHLTCPRCGRYLGAALPGAAALCPRCGVWATGD